MLICPTQSVYKMQYLKILNFFIPLPIQFQLNLNANTKSVNSLIVVASLDIVSDVSDVSDVTITLFVIIAKRSNVTDSDYFHDTDS